MVGGPYPKHSVRLVEAWIATAATGPTKECLGCDRTAKNDHNSPNQVQSSPLQSNPSLHTTDSPKERVQGVRRYRSVPTKSNQAKSNAKSITSAQLFQERLGYPRLWRAMVRHRTTQVENNDGTPPPRVTRGPRERKPMTGCYHPVASQS